MNRALAELIWYAPGFWPLAAALVAAIITAICWLYTPQVRLLSPAWRWTLPTLRIAALVALAASILKPVAVRARDRASAGAVLILVDRSRSMSARDLAYVPAQIASSHDSPKLAGPLVELAAGLGMIKPDANAQLLHDLRDQVEELQEYLTDLSRARSELDYTRISGRGVEAAQNRVNQSISQVKSAAADLVAKAGSVPSLGSLRKSLIALASLNQIEATDPWLAESNRLAAAASSSLNSAQSTQAGEQYASNPQIRDLCNQLAKMSRFDRVELALTDPAAGLIGKFPTDVPLFGFGIADDVSPLPLRGNGQPVRQLLIHPDAPHTDLTGNLRQALARVNGQPLAAVVLFSDGRQVGGDPTVPSTLTASGVPIFAINSAARVPLTDIAISELSIPTSVYVGETVTARVTVRSSGFNGAVANLQLAADGKTQSQSIDLQDHQPAVREFQMKFDKPGVQHIVASIPPQDGEASDENNQIDRWIKVLSDKVNVAILGGPAGWDFQYVRNALVRTPWVNLQSAILEGDRAHLMLTPEEILSQDLVLLFNVPARTLSDAQWDALNKLVTERGGSVILVAQGRQSFDDFSDQPLAANLLPYRTESPPAWHNWPGPDSFFHLVPAPGAQTLDALKLDDSSDLAPAERWLELPALYHYLSPAELKPNAKPLLVERESQSPVLVESRVGLGRSFFLGTDETWRWRYKIGEKDQDRFWLQLIRYAADEPYAVRAATTWLDADKIAAEPGQPIKIRARILNADGSPSADAHPSAQLIQDGQSIRQIPLSPAPPLGLGRYQATLTDLPTGDFELRLSDAHLPLHIASSSEIEMSDLSASDQPMRRLAEASGGAVLSLDQIATLPDRIAQANSNNRLLAEQPLWDSYYLFLFVLACFAAEWALRKRFGLV